MRRVGRITAAVAGAAAALALYVAWSLSEEVLHPERPRLSSEPGHATPAALGLPFETVEFPGSRGCMLRGWWIPAAAEGPAPAALFAHGNGQDRRAGLGPAAALRARGFGVLLFDLSGRGDSDGDMHTLGHFEREDVRAAVAWLGGRRDVDTRAIVLWGRSAGAVSAILALGDGLPACAAVLDSPFSDFASLGRDYLGAAGVPYVPFYALGRLVVRMRAGFDPDGIRPVETIPEVRAPVLLIVRDGDTLVPTAHSDRLLAAAPAELRERVRVPGAGHNGPLPAEIEARAANFLARNAGAGRRGEL